jgi:glycosyltransferase involved in cell wall biosynthesis
MHIAIVAHNAYRMLSGSHSGHVGGVERQAAMLARWLAGRGHRVSLITWHEGGPAIEEIDGIRVIKTCRADAGLPLLRFLVPRWSSLNRALHLADAEIYYQNGAEEVTGQVGLWCRRNRRQFIFSTASDMDCEEHPARGGSLRERVLYRYGLRAAHRVIVQSQKQARMLEASTGLAATVLPMPGEDLAGLAGGDSHAPPSASPLLLMVGRIAPEKNVEMFLDVARSLPGMQFLIVGGPVKSAGEYFERVTRLAAELPNVDFFGSADRHQLASLYRSATALCCTSHYEGFPNTFIEAWSVGLPVVSTVDPDGVIARHGLGAHVSSAEEMRCRLSEIALSPELRARIARVSRAYFESMHLLDKAMARFESLFQGTS